MGQSVNPHERKYKNTNVNQEKHRKNETYDGRGIQQFYRNFTLNHRLHFQRLLRYQNAKNNNNNINNYQSIFCIIPLFFSHLIIKKKINTVELEIQ